MPPDLPPDYYLTNFHALVDGVAARYTDLLNDQERDWYARFGHCSLDAQCLYVRLMSRTRSHFRLNKLDYPEIANLRSAADVLKTNGLISFDPELDIEDLAPLYVKAELLDACTHPPPKTLQRDAIIAGIAAESNAWSFDPLRLKTHGPILQIEGEAHFLAFRLLFFGNLYQDLSDFVLRDLGLTAFEAYTVDANTRAFQSRAQIDAHLRYHACRAIAPDTRLMDVETLLALHAALPPADTTDPALCRRVGRFTNELARQLERLDEPQHALALYAQTKQPPARERRARVQAAQGNVDAALLLCREIADEPLDADESDFAEMFAQRLLRKLGQRGPVPAPAKPREITLDLRPSEHSVEVSVATHLAVDCPCFYTENTLFTGVCGLAFWDVVFSPVPGAFHNSFQHAPADFRGPEFRTARASAIDARLAALQQPGELIERARRTFVDKAGLANPLVNWGGLSAELLDLALERIPTAHWNAVFAHMLSDLSSYRAGFPDLVHFPREGGYELIEVKAPGDRLQKNQLRWMRFFTQQGIPHHVIHVRWLDATVPQ